MRIISRIWLSVCLLIVLCVNARAVTSAPAALVPGVHMVLEVDLRKFPDREVREDVIAQSAEVVSRRLNELGAKSVTVERDGDDRIRVEMAGYSDVALLKKLFGPPPGITLQLVDETASKGSVHAGNVAQDEVILDYAFAEIGDNQPSLAVHKEVLLDGDSIADAISALDERSMLPVVDLHFDQQGAEKFANITKANMGNRLAIVMDGKILSAPLILQPVLDGSVQISGKFTTLEAGNLALLLRGAAVPAPLRILELRATGSPE